MGDMSFEVNESRYRAILENGSEAGIKAVAEQALTDSNEYVKYDRGNLHDSSRIEKGTAGDVYLTWNTPYALKQYYTGTPINHGTGHPSLQWAHMAYRIHGAGWKRIMDKFFAEGMK